MTQQHYVDKPGGLKTGSHPMKTERLKQDPRTGQVVKDEKIPVPGTGDPVAEPAPQAAPRIRHARETQLQNRTAKVQGFAFIADHGTVPEDLLRPEFWAGCAQRLQRRPGDCPTEVTVWAEDGSFWAELVVIEAGARWAKCRFKSEPILVDQSARSEIAFKGHVVNFGGETEMWRVIRDSDKSKLKDSFATAEQALAWLQDHVRSMAA